MLLSFQELDCHSHVGFVKLNIKAGIHEKQFPWPHQKEPFFIW